MGKRKLINKPTDQSFGVNIKIEKLDDHPICLHGPTLLFSSGKQEFYACSSCRDKKECRLHISKEDWKDPKIKQRNKKYLKLIPTLNKSHLWDTYCKVKLAKELARGYCLSCEQLFLETRYKDIHNDHNFIKPLSEVQLKEPSSWLPPKQNNKVEAQYTFSNTTVKVFLDIFQKNDIRKVICIGTPSIHEALQHLSNIDSLLLDIDTRYSSFNPPHKYIWYNMFNNYLFDSINNNDDADILHNFMRHCSGSVCLIMDPPFGGRVEPLVETLRQLTASYNTVNKTTIELMPVLWVFPYFAEPYICNMLPQLTMHDYQVEYINHSKFRSSTNKSRKFGSPVRIFTNLPLASIYLSNDCNYKLCEKCQIWVSKTNSHCEICQSCTSKNGMTYKHCDICERCVKPTFFHCTKCRRCCQSKEHVCGVVIATQACYSCGLKGHKKLNCPLTNKHKVEEIKLYKKDKKYE